ncbi:MAG: AMP-binding protein [Polyangiaceae bacterium]|nr:AMP-binding protein [Polyangiaceae bacterium]MCW5790366.1 AMP-binding protein [Polyangiaceae bacterium]
MTPGFAALSLTSAAREHPHGDALITPSGTLSFAALAAGAQRAAAWLEREGLLTSQLIALVASPDQRSIELTLACVDLGIPLAFVHPRLSEGERAALLERFVATRSAPLIIPPADWGSAHPRAVTQVTTAGARGVASFHALLFTSGSSGAPKAVELGAEQFLAAAWASAENLGWITDDRWLLSLPLAHVGGLSVVLRCLTARRAVVLPPPGSGLDAQRLARAVEGERVSLMSLVPTQLGKLLDWRPPPSLRAALIGGAAAPPTLLARARAARIPTLTTYGATEACSQIATEPFSSELRRAAPREDGAVGKPVARTAVEIRDGLIAVRGPQLMRGYAPEQNRQTPQTKNLEAGWLVTSDRGELTRDGWLRVFGRADCVIITGGENVHPMEVEQLLLLHPAVEACAVVGVPDEMFGQRVAALLVGEPEQEASLRAYLEQALAPHRRPRVMRWASALPALPSGKTDRQRVMAQLEAAARLPRGP